MIAKLASENSSTPIKWHGGKTYLASRIIELMPEHTHYIEPFFGGGAVLFRKPGNLVERHSEVVNDIYGCLVNFWRVLQSRNLFPEFLRQVSMTPMSKLTWEQATECDSDDPIERACAFFVRYRQSRQGLGKDFATMSRTRTRRGMNEQVSSWLSAIDGLPDAHERLKRVVIYSESAVKVIKREDDATSLFYCDPPYLQETRVVKNAYTHEMKESDHVDLLNALGSVQGKFILSGYANSLYESEAKRHGWTRVDIEIDNKASSQKIKPKKTECLWMNF